VKTGGWRKNRKERFLKLTVYRLQTTDYRLQTTDYSLQPKVQSLKE